MTKEPDSYDVAIIGAGLGGLIATALLAQQGKKVFLSDLKAEPGGRAASSVRKEYIFNQGAHALYLGGPAARVLKDLKIDYTGSYPADDLMALSRGKIEKLPSGFLSLLTTGLLGVGGKLELIRFLASVPSMKADGLDSVSSGDWLTKQLRQPDAVAVVTALGRVTTYCNAPESFCAAALLKQLQLAVKGGVKYLDGGWQSLVDALMTKIFVMDEVQTLFGLGTKVAVKDGTAIGVQLTPGKIKIAKSVLITGGPSVASLLGDDSPYLTQKCKELVPIKAGCLDVALRQLPNPKCKFILDIDSPRYFSVHSEYARLAPEGGALIHLMYYLQPGEKMDSKALRSTLEDLLELAQPGWKQYLVDTRFLPDMTVAFGYPDIRTGGFGGRANPIVPDVKNLYVAGDWVGSSNLLFDATVNNVRIAVDAILAKETEEGLVSTSTV